MKRLIDEDNLTDSPSHLLAELVRATPRIEPDDFQKHRVLTKVRFAQRRARPRFRAAVAVVLLASGSATAATVGRLAVRGRGFHFSTNALVSVPIPPATPVPTAAASHAIDVESLAPVAEISTSQPGADEPRTAAKPAASPARIEAQSRFLDVPAPAGARASATGGRAAAVEAPAVRGGAAGVPSGADGASTPPVDSSRFGDSEDAAQVVEAIGALRNKGDGVRAGALLAGYLSAHPHGVLEEDALALSIEAAAARQDPSSAADYGRLYLKQFPNGRFRAVALRASKMAQR